MIQIFKEFISKEEQDILLSYIDENKNKNKHLTFYSAVNTKNKWLISFPSRDCLPILWDIDVRIKSFLKIPKQSLVVDGDDTRIGSGFSYGIKDSETFPHKDIAPIDGKIIRTNILLKAATSGGKSIRIIAPINADEEYFTKLENSLCRLISKI